MDEPVNSSKRQTKMALRGGGRRKETHNDPPSTTDFATDAALGTEMRFGKAALAELFEKLTAPNDK